MASTVVAMILKLDDQASPGLKKVGKEADTVDRSFMKTKISAKQVGAGLAGLGLAAIGAAKAFVAMGKDFSAQINLFNDMSVSTGLTVGTLEKLQLMAAATGVNFSTMERGLVSFQRNLGEARTGTGTLVDALEMLQLDPTTFEDTDDALVQVLDRIAEYGDAADQARLLNDAFGIAAKDMVKVMQTGFGAAGTSIELLGLSIQDVTEDAKESQRGIALYELVLKRLKSSAFEALLGGGGFSKGLSVVIGLITGLKTLIIDLTDILVGFLSAVGLGIKSLTQALVGNFDEAYRTGIRAQDQMDRMAGGIIDIATLDPFKQGTEAALDFDEAMATLGKEVERDAKLLEELTKLQDETAKSHDKSARSVRSFTTALEEESKALESVVESGRRANAAIDKFLGREFRAELARSGPSIELMSSHLKDSAQSIDRLIDPMTDAQRLLTDTFGPEARSLTKKASELLEEYRSGYEDLLAIEPSADLLGVEDEVERLKALHEELANLLLIVGNIEIVELGLIPENVIDLAAQLEAEIAAASRELEIKAGVSIVSMKISDVVAERMAIREAIAEGLEVGAGATLALFQGDVAGAAGCVAAAAGASPIVGGIIAGINTLAEIGQMTVNEVKQNTRAFIDNLSNGFRVLAQALPEVIQILLRNLPAALIESSFTWIPLLVAELPLAIMRGVVDGIKSILGLIGEAIRNAFSLRGQDDERRFSFGAVEPPSFAVGTAKVNRTGMALIHRGETIIPAGGRESQTQAARIGAGAVNINISTAILDRDVVPRLVREIDRVTGSLGRTRANFAGT